jgi:rfaE bifunctional protein nucleotidyltransferase chain/domain
MSTQNKIVTLKKFLEIKDSKLQGRKIVFTNGCFDIVHLGHIDYLEKAKDKGDVLVLGLNTDQSIQRLKGKNRPIIDQTARARLMAALEFVDFVILFEDETPLNLIEAIKPDILVKGNDYQTSNIVGADIVLSNGGKVETIELVPGYSTSALIELIKEKNK